MSCAAIYDKLTAVHCEEIAERFVKAMYAQATHRNRGEITAKDLARLWADVLTWTDCGPMRDHAEPQPSEDGRSAEI